MSIKTTNIQTRRNLNRKKIDEYQHEEEQGKNKNKKNNSKKKSQHINANVNVQNHMKWRK